MQLAGWGGPVGEEGGVEVSTMIGAEVPITAKLSPVAWVGVLRHADGAIDPRDATVGLVWTAVARPDLVLRVQPGLNVPLGGVGSDLRVTPLSTASVDPTLTAQIVYGEAWLVGATAVGRVSLYDGWDRYRQGAFLRFDPSLARRIGSFVPWAGLSVVRRGPSDPVDDLEAPAFSELALTVGTVVNLARRWSLAGQVRAPVWGTDLATTQVGMGLSARWVVGGPAEEEHHEGDGHDH